MTDMKVMTTMTKSSIRRPSRRGHSTTDKVVSAGLAVAACAGLIGVIAVRTGQDAQAADAQASTEVTDSTLVAATTSTGLTQAQLDDYAAQLEAERIKLIDYRDQLALAAASLQGTGGLQAALPSAKSGAAIKSPSAASAKQKSKAAKAKAKAATSKPKVTAPAQQAEQPQILAAPQAKPAPRPQAQVQQQQAAPRPQAQTKSS
jgi:hypothetical protein